MEDDQINIDRLIIAFSTPMLLINGVEGSIIYSLHPTLFVLYSILRCPKILSCF